MRCEACKGTGRKVIYGPSISHTFFDETLGEEITIASADFAASLPCPDCGGCGIAHCCEGERPGNVCD
jgi:hypothetical protein